MVGATGGCFWEEHLIQSHSLTLYILLVYIFLQIDRQLWLHFFTLDRISWTIIIFEFNHMMIMMFENIYSLVEIVIYIHGYPVIFTGAIKYDFSFLCRIIQQLSLKINQAES